MKQNQSYNKIPETAGKIYGLPKLEFIEAVQKLENMTTISEKLDYYFEVTGNYFRDVNELYKINGEVYEWTVPLHDPVDYNERAKWFINKFKNERITGKIDDYERRLTNCKTATAKLNLSNVLLNKIHKKLSDTESFTKAGFDTEQIRGNPKLQNAGHIEDVDHFCNGMVLCHLKEHIEERIAQKFSSDHVILINENEKKVAPEPDNTYTDFDQLFVDKMETNPDTIKQCYQILKDAEIIGDENNFIKPPNAIIAVWYQALKSKGLIRRLEKDNDKIAVKLLMKKFRDLKLWDSSLRETHLRSEKKYLPLFQKDLPKLPQSPQSPQSQH